MKGILVTSLLLLCTLYSFGQQAAASDDATLLEYYQDQRFGDAADYLKKIHPEPVSDLKTLKSLAYVSLMANRLPDAESYYQRVYEADTSGWNVLLSLGSINLRRGNSAKAKVYYLKVLEKDSTNFSVYKQLARISFDATDLAGYQKYLDKANQLNNTDADVAAELSDLYVTMKLNPKAEQVLSKAIEADPENVVLQESLLKLVYAQLKWSETVIVGEKLMQLGDMAPPILSKVGQAYYNLKNYQCGIETLTAIEANAQNETTFYFTAACYKQLHNQTKAIAYFKRSVEAGISPNIDSYYSEMADSYGIMKNHSKAIASYQKALQFDQKPMTYYAIANLYDTELKDKKSAIKYYKKYLAAKPPVKQQSYIAYTKSRIAVLNN